MRLEVIPLRRGMVVVEDLKIFPPHITDESASAVCGTDHQDYLIDTPDNVLRWVVENFSQLLAVDKRAGQEQKR